MARTTPSPLPCGKLGRDFGIAEAASSRAARARSSSAAVRTTCWPWPPAASGSLRRTGPSSRSLQARLPRVALEKAVAPGSTSGATARRRPRTSLRAGAVLLLQPVVITSSSRARAGRCRRRGRAGCGCRASGPVEVGAVAGTARGASIRPVGGVLALEAVAPARYPSGELRVGEALVGAVEARLSGRVRHHRAPFRAGGKLSTAVAGGKRAPASP